MSGFVLGEIGAARPRRQWLTLTHCHGRILNASAIARSLGESHATVRRHFDLLMGALVVRQLPLWYANLGNPA
jgi:hypothetical protein